MFVAGGGCTWQGCVCGGVHGRGGAMHGRGKGNVWHEGVCGGGHVQQRACMAGVCVVGGMHGHGRGGGMHMRGKGACMAAGCMVGVCVW